jgi:hypothetical protein
MNIGLGFAGGGLLMLTVPAVLADHPLGDGT